MLVSDTVRELDIVKIKKNQIKQTINIYAGYGLPPSP